jgi:type I restriction enzyme R subunit
MEREGNTVWEGIAWPAEDFDTVHCYDRNLPHWRMEDACYFVTFRLADSIPQPIAEAWAEESRRWLAMHGISNDLAESEWRRRYEAISSGVRRAFEREQIRMAFVELDKCHGSCVLRQSELADIVANALRFHHGVRLRCGDFVIMPNHVHWLVLPMAGFDLERIMQSVKRWCARHINERLGAKGPLWQKESFDHIVRNPTELERIRDYIAENPAKARLGKNEYVYYAVDTL